MKTHVPRFGFLVLFLLCVASASAADIKVMTQNQYLGTDLAPILAAPPGGFNDAVVLALRKIAATSPTERVKALAVEIMKEQPALVGLQEVYWFTCTNISGDACSDSSIAGAFTNHLQDTYDALNGTYEVAATVVNMYVPGVPFEINGDWAYVGVIDRDVILRRADVSASPVNYSAVCSKTPMINGCNYSTVVTGSTPYGDISVERGFVAVDATVNGQAYRVVNTHLELQYPDPTNPLSEYYQAAQAYELWNILLATTPSGSSLVLLGDMNSSPEHPAVIPGLPTPYQQFVAVGYTDAWTLRPGTTPEYTCCQLDDLSNQQSALYERIDMIFSLVAPDKVKSARVVGATVSDRTPPPGLGLWPSDHGAVTAELQF